MGGVPKPASEVNSAAARLDQRLQKFGLRVKPIVADGACQFRAVADQLFGDQERHVEVRKRTVAKLQENPKRFSEFVHDETWPSYLKRMACVNEWGDNLTLQAMAT